MNNAAEPNETGIRFQLDGEHSLAVNSTNTEAINLYKKFRFVEYGIEPNALKIEVRYFAEMLMDRLSVS
jgi:ribosomal protein S18 acetylase RimI-like enzyme